VVIASWPVARPERIDDAVEASIERLQAVVLEVRRFRSDQGVKPADVLPARLEGLGQDEPAARTLLKLKPAEEGFIPTAALTTSVGVRIELDLSVTVNVAAERARLGRDRAAAEKELAQTGRKLADEAFRAKAPAPVVDKIRQRNAAAAAEIARIDAALGRLADD
jgi:valyl-tRNA synthetase